MLSLASTVLKKSLRSLISAREKEEVQETERERIVRYRNNDGVFLVTVEMQKRLSFLF
jgi:hypothetical protein